MMIDFANKTMKTVHLEEKQNVGFNGLNSIKYHKAESIYQI